jgi:hypothetical protein
MMLAASPALPPAAVTKTAAPIAAQPLLAAMSGPQALATQPVQQPTGSMPPGTVVAQGATVPTGDTPLQPFDASGILRPVIARRSVAPDYALVDDLGQVLSFVTPGPNVNLQPYLGRRVGIYGLRGFLPQYQRSHLTAGRVTPLDGQVLR